MLYEDDLVAIDDSSLTLKRYYFPFFTAKTVRLDKIQKVDYWPASIWHGRFRIMGFRDWETWFAWDASRPTREGVFVVTLNNAWLRLGFSVQNCEQVKQILHDKKLLNTQ
jgi:hypothetical protein